MNRAQPVTRPDSPTVGDAAHRLSLVDARLAQIVRSDGLATTAVTAYVNATRGKRLRASLVFVCHELFASSDDGSGSRQLVDLATAVELVHLASLLHDDVVDGAGERRGMPTVARRWGAPIAVLAGDYLFAAAFEMMVQTQQYNALGHLSRALRAMSEAEIEQQAQAYTTDAAEDHYWRLVRGKTGALFAAACAAGANSGSASRAATDLMGEFGILLGSAFQVADDLLDLSGDPERLGKPVGQDLTRGFLTLPTIRLLATSSPEAQEVREALANRQVTPRIVAVARQAATDCGAIQYTRRAIRDLLDQAQAQLAMLPPDQRLQASMTLTPLLERVICRDH